MFLNLATILIFLLAPAGVIALCRRFKVLGKIGPVLILYMLGLIVGNCGVRAPGLASIQDIMSSVAVPVAIPLMLFSCTFRKSETRSQLLALITGVAAVIVAVVVGYLIFGRGIPDGAKIGGMLTGVYTGGTVNLASLQAMLSVPEETYILLNSYDMIVSFLYLVLLLSFGYKLLRRWLPNETVGGADDMPVADGTSETNPYKGLFSKAGLKDLGVQTGIAAVIIAVSGGAGLLAGDGAFMAVFILCLTTLSIAASFLKCLKGRKYGYDVGMYSIYVFSIVVASMADLKSLTIAEGLSSMGYLTFVIFGSLLLQIILAKIFRIDSDTVVISSVAFICSPPFVPMMAGAMRNRRIIAAGLAVGVFGYAAGNYLGFLMAKLLTLI